MAKCPKCGQVTLKFDKTLNSQACLNRACRWVERTGWARSVRIRRDEPIALAWE